MNKIEQLNTCIGKLGFFFNSEDEKTHKVGRLKSVTANGNCEDEDGCYYDNFTPMKLADLLDWSFSLKCPITADNNHQVGD